MKGRRRDLGKTRVPLGTNDDQPTTEAFRQSANRQDKGCQISSVAPCPRPDGRRRAAARTGPRSSRKNGFPHDPGRANDSRLPTPAIAALGRGLSCVTVGPADELPEEAEIFLEAHLSLPPLDGDMVIAVLRGSHSLKGKVADAAIIASACAGTTTAAARATT